MLSYLLYLLKISKKVENEQKSFYLCTRSEISELQEISKCGNFVKIEKANFEIFENVFENLQIIKISYSLKSGENLILGALNSKGINVLTIMISKDKDSLETIEFVNVVEMNSYKYEHCFDEVIYIVENDIDVMEKMKIALKFIKLNENALKTSKNIHEILKSIKKDFKCEFKEKNNSFDFEKLDELNIKYELLLFVILDSELFRKSFKKTSNQEDSDIYFDQKLTNFTAFNIKIIENVVDTLEKINDEITKDHLSEFKECIFSKTKEAVSDLKLINEDFLKLNEKIARRSKKSESNGEYFAEKIVLIIDGYLIYRRYLDRIIERSFNLDFKEIADDAGEPGDNNGFDNVKLHNNHVYEENVLKYDEIDQFYLYGIKKLILNVSLKDKECVENDEDYTQYLCNKKLLTIENEIDN